MARSFDDLARRICVATATLSRGKDNQWTSIAKIATLLQITNEEIIQGATQYAGQKAWLKVVGNPAQRFSPGRHAAVSDFAVSTLGVICGGAAWWLAKRATVSDPPIGRPGEA